MNFSPRGGTWHAGAMEVREVLIGHQVLEALTVRQVPAVQVLVVPVLVMRRPESPSPSQPTSCAKTTFARP